MNVAVMVLTLFCLFWAIVLQLVQDYVNARWLLVVSAHLYGATALLALYQIAILLWEE